MAAARVWVVAYIPQQMIRVGSQIILAGLLSVHAFGLARLATTVVRGLRMMSEVGIRQSIVRSPRGDSPDFLDTAWTMQAIRGVLLFVLALVLAIPLAEYYSDDALKLMIPVIGLSALVEGLESTKIVELNRVLNERPRAFIEVSRGLLSRAVMILLAIFVTQSAWALVLGVLAGSMYSLIMTHRLPGHRNRLHWDRSSVSEIWGFGKWIFLGTAIAYFGAQIDSLLVGKLGQWNGRTAIGTLGVYGVALTIARMPLEVSEKVSAHVFYPIVSRYVRERRLEFARRSMRARAAVLPSSGFLVIVVVCVSPWFFMTLYPDSFHDATWIAPLATVGVWISILNDTANRLLLAVGNSRALALSGAVRVVVAGVACVFGYVLHGLPGLIVGVAVGALAEHVFDSLALGRRGVSLTTQDLAVSLVVALACGAIVVWRLVLVKTFGKPVLVYELLLAGPVLLAYGFWALQRVRRIL